MLILSIDSAGQSCAACVWRDGKVLAAAEEVMERGQDQRLMPLILEIMQKASVDFKDLDRVAVIRGPGSFTGLRIGLAAARGIGLAADKPVIGIDRFAIYREQIKEQKNLLVVINSKRKELYCKFYPTKGAAEEPVMMTVEEIENFLKDKNSLVAGDVDLKNIINVHEKEVVVSASLAAHAKIKDTNYLPRPLYIRAPDVTFKKPDIQKISADQAPLLATLHRESFGPAGWDMKQMEGSLALDTTEGWSASTHQELTGFILCQFTPEAIEILTFCVKPDRQRQKIGERLLRHAVQESKTRGATKVFLEVAADNVAAIKLYEKAGFKITGKRANYYKRDEKQVDALAFTLTL